MNTTISAFLALTSFSFAAVPNTFSSGKSVVAREVNENFTYLDTTMAKKADSATLSTKADASLKDSVAALKSTLIGKVDQSGLTAALSPMAKKTYVDSAAKATLASAIQANTASIPNIDGARVSGQTNPDNLKNFESGISGADGPNKPWDWAVYQTLAPYAGGSIQMAGRHCAGCGSSYALRTKDDNNASLKWSPWYTLWHSGNLTASTLPGGPYLSTGGGSISGWVGISGNAGVSLSVASTEPVGATLQQFVTGAGANNNKWDNYVAYNQQQYRLVSDDYKSANAWLTVTRLGTTVESIELRGKTAVGGDLTVAGKTASTGDAVFGSGNNNIDSPRLSVTDGNYGLTGSAGALHLFSETGQIFIRKKANGVFVQAGQLASENWTSSKFLASSGGTLKGDLHVSGNLTARPNIPVADYVFEPDYKLASLSEVEAYTKEHKHLPEVPSATEIGKSGLDLAQMNLVLLKKVEELTLHAIEQEKEIADLKSSVQELKSR